MTRKLLKALLAAACTMIIAACCTGCSAFDKSTGHGGKRIALFIHGNQAGLIRNLNSSIRKYAAEDGATIDVYNANQNGDKQIRQLKAAARKHYDAFIVRPVEPENAQEITAIADGIPVVFYNFQPAKSALKANQNIYVGPEEEMAGRLQADYILKHTSKQTLNVAILQGPSSLVAEKRTAALKKELNKSGRTVNYVYNDSANWEEETAEHQMNLFIKTGQSCDAIASNNDNMALGALKAFRKAHKKLPVACGVDASDDGLKAIKNGTMGLSAAQSTDVQGKMCIKAAIQLIKGKKITDLKGATDDGLYVYTKMEAVTSANVSNY